jgi:hypothetical protein
MPNQKNRELPDSRIQDSQYIYSYDALFSHAIAFGSQECDQTPFIDRALEAPFRIQVPFHFMTLPEAPLLSGAFPKLLTSQNLVPGHARCRRSGCSKRIFVRAPRKGNVMANGQEVKSFIKENCDHEQVQENILKLLLTRNSGRTQSIFAAVTEDELQVTSPVAWERVLMPIEFWT